MPDIDFQKIELNLIPKKGDEPVIFYASQYESARPFIADLKWGNSEFAPGDDCYAEIDIRKNDNNLVVITEDVAIDNNEVSVVLPVQAVTCIGKNLGQVKIYAADEHLIAALNFILEVQPDPLAGGVDSETAIDNLTTQIESIAEEVISEDYYDKTEVDALLNDKADVSDLPDMTQYYTKTQTDTLLNGKADASTTYTKTEVDNALALKANSSDLATVATTGDYNDLINKPVLPDMTQYYTKSEVDAIVDYMLPVVSDSGPIATINVGLERLFKTITVDPLATQVVRCGVNLFDDSWITGNTTNVVTLPAGTYYFKGFVGGEDHQNTRFEFYFNGEWNTITSAGTFDDNGITWSGTTFGWLYSDNFATVTLTKPYQVRALVTATTADTRRLAIYTSNILTFYAYNGNTYPVADISTITTLNGVNNIYADAGDVSVSAYDSIQHYIDNQ